MIMFTRILNEEIFIVLMFFAWVLANLSSIAAESYWMASLSNFHSAETGNWCNNIRNQNHSMLAKNREAVSIKSSPEQIEKRSGAMKTLYNSTHVLRMFPESIWRWWLYSKTRIDYFCQIYLNCLNLLTPGVHFQLQVCISMYDLLVETRP